MPPSTRSNRARPAGPRPTIASQLPTLETAQPVPSRQSILDWASPEEERNNPGKLEASGQPLASYRDLRTRASNAKRGNWTLEHALHAAEWAFFEAGYRDAFEKDCPQLAEVTKFMVHMQTSCYPLGVGRDRFTKAYDQFLSRLKETAFAAAQHNVSGAAAHNAAKTLRFREWDWQEFRRDSSILAMKLASPTGRLPRKLADDVGIAYRSRALKIWSPLPGADAPVTTEGEDDPSEEDDCSVTSSAESLSEMSADGFDYVLGKDPRDSTQDNAEGQRPSPGGSDSGSDADAVNSALQPSRQSVAGPPSKKRKLNDRDRLMLEMASDASNEQLIERIMHVTKKKMQHVLAQSLSEIEDLVEVAVKSRRTARPRTYKLGG